MGRALGPRGGGALAVALAALAGAVVLGAAGPTAGASGTTTYYLAVGASESLGVQPAAGHPGGRPTEEGYANDLATTERARWPGLQLVEVGCPGETAVQAVEGGGPCAYPAGSQLASAVAFLREHPRATALVTVDLGFNDLRPCVAHEAVDQACVESALEGIERVLPRALAELEAAGGPGLHLVGLEHDDPYLSDYLGGPAGEAFATASLAAIGQLNATLDRLYAAGGAAVAQVSRAFDTGDQRPAPLAGHGTVPAEVAQLCVLSWSCQAGPDRHNVHPDAAGYQAIADAVAAALGTARTATPGR